MSRVKKILNTHEAATHERLTQACGKWRARVYPKMRIAEAVERHGYTQKAIAAHLGLHFTSISQILRRGHMSIK